MISEFVGKIMRISLLADSPTIAFVSFGLFILIREVGL